MTVGNSQPNLDGFVFLEPETPLMVLGNVTSYTFGKSTFAAVAGCDLLR
jgi:hypothetical protein